MARKANPNNPPCPHCQGCHVRRNGRDKGRQRWYCLHCRRSFGPTFGTPLYGLHTPAEEVARSLLVVMRRGSLSAAEEVTGHKYETIGTWLRRAGAHAEALSDVLAKDLNLSEVEVDAFWSFVKKSVPTWATPPPPRKGWGHAGAVCR